MTESELRQYLRRNECVWRVLQTAESFGLSRWYVGAGAVCQTVWNIKHGFAPNEHIKDIDLIYFDRNDLSSAAEDRIQSRLTEKLSGIRSRIDVVNQARVHLWYETTNALAGWGRNLDSRGYMLAC